VFFLFSRRVFPHRRTGRAMLTSDALRDLTNETLLRARARRCDSYNLDDGPPLLEADVAALSTEMAPSAARLLEAPQGQQP
jgi:hypothetical protein